MSEINIYCREEYLGEIYPGIGLIRVTDCIAGFTAPNGVAAEDGRYGFTTTNDPFVIYSVPPEKNPGDGKFNDMADGEAARLMGVFDVFERETTGNISDMAKLMEGIRKAGYSEEEHGTCTGWFISDTLARFVENRAAVETYERCGFLNNIET